MDIFEHDRYHKFFWFNVQLWIAAAISTDESFSAKNSDQFVEFIKEQFELNKTTNTYDIYTK